jgi:hypothetical protein
MSELWVSSSCAVECYELFTFCLESVGVPAPLESRTGWEEN